MSAAMTENSKRARKGTKDHEWASGTHQNVLALPRPPIQSSVVMYKTTQLRRERFRKFGNCKSAPLIESPASTTTELKSYSSTSLTQMASIPDDPIFSYIKTARGCLGLETEPMQSPSELNSSVRESLLVSSGPITGVKDLKLLSRRLSEISSPTRAGSTTVEFVYAVARQNRTGCSVYDLVITQPDKARALGTYYTVSAFNVSEVDKDTGMESISTLRWLWERSVFLKISSIPYFKNFMIRRAFKMWHHLICHRKTSKHKASLKSRLFSADMLLQKALLRVQSICETASSSSFSHYLECEQTRAASEIKLISLSEGCTYSLEQFTTLQEQTVKEAQQRLHTLRDAVVTVIVSVCQEVADREHITELSSQAATEGAPPHTKVLEWRATLERLERLSCLCGQLVMQLLQRLVLKAVSSLLLIMRRLVRLSLTEVDAQDERFWEMRERVASNPYTQGILDTQDVSLDEEDQDHMGLVSMQASSFTTLLPSVEAGVGSLTELAEAVAPPQPSAVDSDDLLAELFKTPEQPVLPLWEVHLTLDPTHQSVGELSFSPSLDQFQSAIATLLGQYEHLVAEFRPLFSDDRIQPFISCTKFDLLKTLEMEEAGKKNSNERIDCYSLLHNYAPYQHIVSQLYKCVSLTLTEVERKLMHYMCYSKMVGVCHSARVSTSACESWSVPLFQRNFALYHDQVHAMESMVQSFQVGVVLVRASDYQTVCLSHPQGILAVLEECLPRLASIKCDKLSSEIKGTTEKLLDTPSNVAGFIRYLADVDIAVASVPLLEKGLLTATNMYNVAQQFEVPVVAEEMALYKSLFPQFRRLKNCLMQAQATKSETVYQFSTDLRKMVVQVLKDANNLRTAIESPALSDDSSDKSLEALAQYETQLTSLLTLAKNYVDYHHLFSTIPSSTRRYHAVDPSAASWSPEEVYDEVVSMSQVLKARQALFTVARDWATKRAQWRALPIPSLNISQLQKEVNDFINQIDYLEKELSSSHKLVSQLQCEVGKFRSWLPTLSCLLNPALKMRHWELIHQTTGEASSLAQGQAFTIDYLQGIKIFEHHSTIVSVSNEANHEALLENMLKKVSSYWMDRELVLEPHRGMTERPTHTLSRVEELLATIEDSLLTINTLNSSRYINPIRHSVVDWQRRLVLMLETVECWVHCQKIWLYLESIFAAVDIQRQLSSEAKLFLQADKSLREVVRVIAEKPTALKATNTPGVLEALQSCSILFEQVFKNLEDFLESKRIGFPRFYFISNEELLDILAHTKQPLTVQSYLSKLFTNVRSLDAEVVSPVAATVHGLVSNQEEMISLYKTVNARGAPEKWMCSLNSTSCETVRRLLKQGLDCYNERNRVKWAAGQPGQVAITVTLLKWTEAVESCFMAASPSESLQALLETWSSHIVELTGLCHTEGDSKGVLATLLTQSVHCRDVIQSLINDKVVTSDNFQWNRHLRYYWSDTSSSVNVSQLCAQFPYGNEYLGCSSRLVVTPLTQRCYLTLTSALHVHLGGMLLGPAGTGKSETVKDLAKAMGRFCLLINCSESLKYETMRQILSGLCQSGSWCCFDEFNRLKVGLLSALTQQLKCIKEAKDSNSQRFMFEGREVKLDMCSGIFITMNPSYAGRVELPESMKVFFRPIAMVTPDTLTIAEVLLLSSGFIFATNLARKLTKLFEFMESQASKQAHYDFGLRAVKTVVSAAGAKLLSARRSTEAVDKDVETGCLVSAVMEVNYPKLLTKDTSVILSLFRDLFGERYVYEDSTDDDKLLLECLKRAAVESSLCVCEAQLLKSVQLFRAIVIRHGVVVMGSTGTGKTTAIQLLRRALNLAGNKHSSMTSMCEEVSNQAIVCDLDTINPKSITLEELYGYTDHNTLEWKNGVVPKVLKKHCEHLASGAPQHCPGKTEKSSMDSLESHSTASRVDNALSLCYPPVAPAGWRWIIMDGPVDPMWIENLNSALDDSKLVCLANNERISLEPGLRFLFETDSLVKASPATVSRCGVVLMDTPLLCWRQYTESWISCLPSEFPSECKQLLQALFDHSIEAGSAFLRAHKSQLFCALPVMGAARTLCSLLQSLLESLLKERPQICASHQQQVMSGSFESQDSSSSIAVQTLAGIYIPKKMSQQEQSSIDHTEHHSVHSELLDLIGKLYVFSFTWAFGGCFESVPEEECAEGMHLSVTRGGNTARAKFDALVHKIFTSSDSIVHVKLPTSPDLIFTYFVDIHNSSFVQWKTLIPTSKQIATKVSLLRRGLGNIGTTFSSPFFSKSGFASSDLTAISVPLIPTLPTVQLAYLASLLSANSTSLMFVGKAAVGKTQFIKHLVDTLVSTQRRNSLVSYVHQAGAKKSYKMASSSTNLIPHTANMDGDSSGFEYQLSMQTTSHHVQAVIENHCTRTGISTLSPAMGDKVVAFLDDLHLPLSDEYGSQACSELLRQLLDHGGWYDRRHLTWKSVDGVQLVTTCGNRGSKSLSERCLSKFSVFCLPELSTDSLHAVYSAHLSTAFGSNKFTEDVLRCIPNLVSCAVFVLGEVRGLLKASPHRPQYTFCTRDLTKLFSRLLHVHHRAVKTTQDVVHVLIHEVQRVFKDRCAPEDRECILNVLSEGLRIHFKMVVPVQKLKEQLLLYESFTSSIGGYLPVKNPKKLVKSLERLQSQYNLTQDKNIQLSLFPQVCEHILRITRVLQQSRGNMILIGDGGLGKRSCVQLAAYIAKCAYHSLSVSLESPGEALEQVKSAVMQCGVSQQPTCLLVTETVCSAQTDMLLSVHELMRGGDVRALFSIEEVESITSQMSEVVAVKQGVECHLSHRELWSLFTERVLGNLHSVLCVSPSSPILGVLYRNYPSLFTHSTVDVFDEWSPKALYGVALREIMNCALARKLKDASSQLSAIAVKMHGMALSALNRADSHLKFTITPTNFIKFMQRFCDIVLEKESTISTQRSRLEDGLMQLQVTNRHVEKMRAELSSLQPEMEQKTEEVEALLCELTVEQQHLDVLRVTVAEERATMVAETERVFKLKQEAEEDLCSVLPDLKQAEKGLNNLRKQHFDEVRSYARPPSMVVHVMSAVCLLLGHPTDWNTAKRITKDGALLKSMYDFDKENVSDKVLTDLKKYTNDEHFTPKSVAYFSFACQSFCQWVLAVQKYAEVYRIVQPKREAYQDVKDKLDIVKKNLRQKESHLTELEEQLCVLEEQHREKMEERNLLFQKCDEISMKLQRAESVMQSLTAEQGRWSDTLSSLSSRQKTMLGDSLLSAACLTYLGPFSVVLRQAMINKWRQLCLENKVPVHRSFTLQETAGDTELIQQWHVAGLPKDAHSVENALIVMQATNTPLIVDPQGQATRWLKHMFSAKLKAFQYNSAELLKDIKECAVTGTSVLVEGVSDCMDMWVRLEPLLTNQMCVKNGQMVWEVDKMEIPCDPSFRLFLVCPKADVLLKSEICNNATVVNFTCTTESLQEQLLSMAVKLIQPQLDATYTELLLSIVNSKRELKHFESELLDVLRNDKGILEDEGVLTALQQLKIIAVDVEQRLESAQHTEQEITSSRNQYLPVATQGSLLYTELQCLTSLSSLYHYSIDWFQQIFCECLHHAAQHDYSTEDLVAPITSAVLNKASWGISAEHYTTFVFKVCCSIGVSNQQHSNDQMNLSTEEWKAMLKVAALLTDDGDNQSIHRHIKLATSKPAFIPQRAWSAVNLLEKSLPCFGGLQTHLVNNLQVWQEFKACSRPVDYLQTITSDDRFTPSSLTSFQKLLLVQTLCPKQFLPEVKNFIGMQLGSLYSDKHQVPLTEVLRSTGPATPILLLCRDMDLCTYLQNLALALTGDATKLVTVYLGEGQEERVLELLKSTAEKGKWIFIDNVSTMTSWLGTLERHLKSLKMSGRVHNDYRLFLCCHPTAEVPQSLITLCEKVCLDAPKSVCSSMQHLFSTNSWVKDVFEGGRYAPSHWKQLLFNLCLFHSALTSMRQGTSMGCVFRTADLQVSIGLLRRMFETYSENIMSLEAIAQLLGNICYGGSVSSKFDQRFLDGLLRHYCCNRSVDSGTIELEPSITYEECVKRTADAPFQEDQAAISTQEPTLSSRTEPEFFQQSLCLVDSRNAKSMSMNEELIMERATMILDSVKSLLSLKLARVMQIPLIDGTNLSLFVDLITREVTEWESRLLFVKESVQGLIDSINSGIVFSEEQQSTSTCLMRNTVPHFWNFDSEGKVSVSQWLEYLSASVSYISKLSSQVVSHTSNKKLPRTFIMSAFASPKGLIAFIKQLFAREMNIPLECVELRAVLACETQQMQSVTIGGVMVAGGSYCQESGLTVIASNSHDSMELICCPINTLDENTFEGTLYQCPVYSSVKQSDLVCTMWVPAAVSHKEFSLKGTCIAVKRYTCS